jgi:hypothetical protein
MCTEFFSRGAFYVDNFRGMCHRSLSAHLRLFRGAMPMINLRPATRSWAPTASLLLLFLPAAPASAVAGAPSPPVIAQRGQKICQLVGECDRQFGGAGQCTNGAYGEPTLSRSESRYGLFGADLGASFDHDGRLYFLFGDSFPSPTINPPPMTPRRFSDSTAYSTDSNPEACLTLDFITSPNGSYLPPQIQVPPGDPAAPVTDGIFEVPTGGFSAGGKMYIFRTTDAVIVCPASKCGVDVIDMNRSILASSDDDAQSFKHLYDVSTDKFINIAPVVVNNADVPGLPTTAGQGLLAWASNTHYRHSDPYLAYVPLDSVEDRTTWRYFAGLQDGLPTWSNLEADAVPLFSSSTPCIGELSVGWNPFLNEWLMLYNCFPTPRGINLRAATQPWGPWSDAEVIFDPVADKGYCHFIHWSDAANPSPFGQTPCDHLANPADPSNPPGNVSNLFGGEYGPYVIARFTSYDASAKATTIYYTMSTAIPYTAVLMKTALQASVPKDKCTAAKLNALGKVEAGLLSCQSTAVAKGDASLLAACIAKVEGKYGKAFAKAGSCGGGEAVCQCLAENCVSAVRAVLPDAGPSKCEAARLKLAGKEASRKLACNATAAKKGVAVNPACIQKAEAKYRAAFAKAPGCSGDEKTLETTVDQQCVSALGRDPIGGGTVRALCASCAGTITTTSVAGASTTR